MSAWNDLSTERPIGMAEGYIPRSKIKAYAVEELELDGDDLEFFITVIRRVDNGYLSNEDGNTKSSEVSIGNVAGVKRLLARLGAAAKDAGRDRFRKKNARKRHRQNDNHTP